MGTAAGIRGQDGVVLAADRRIVIAGTVRSDRLEQLYETEEILVATVGGASAVQAAHRELEAALSEYGFSASKVLRVRPGRRIVDEVVSDTGVVALSGLRDGEGRAHLFQTHPDGGTSEEDRAAIGDGRAVTVGSLETVPRDQPIAELEPVLRDVLETAGERVTTIGGTIDTAVLSDDE